MSEAEPVTELVHVEHEQKLVPARAKSAEDKIQKLQTEIFVETTEMIREVFRFADWPVDDEAAQERLFQSWKAAEGEATATRRRNLMRAAWMGKKDAPVGLAMLQSIYVSEIKARAVESQPKTMNVQLVQMSAPLPNFPRKKVEPDR